MPLNLFKFFSFSLIFLSFSAMLFHQLSTHNHNHHNNTLSKISSFSPNRKLMTSSKFDFTIFLQHLHVDNHPPHHHHRHHHHHHHHRADSPEVGAEIDPRYGVEKRLVPTGPNPLHH
ncbi:hypothetical protein IC575_004838 [Cucumis melo]|uniref:CLAVATA3/ESR (CLE)-related protein 12-like n=1 Tax=Cucumis melo TaxID=3656 RepID=A0A9I9DEM9_CUCME